MDYGFDGFQIRKSKINNPSSSYGYIEYVEWEFQRFKYAIGILELSI